MPEGRPSTSGELENWFLQFKRNWIRGGATVVATCAKGSSLRAAPQGGTPPNPAPLLCGLQELARLL